MTTQYIRGSLVELSPDPPSAPRPFLKEKGGIFGQTSMPLNRRGMFSHRKWSLPPGDMQDVAQDPDWTTRGVTYPVVGLNKRYHAQQMADRRQQVYLQGSGLGDFNPGVVAGVALIIAGLVWLAR